MCLGPRRRLQQYVCQLCYKPFKLRHDFLFHLRAVHAIGDAVQCPHCGRSDFKSRTPYYVHVRGCKRKD